MFQLTNEQRECFGIQPVSDDWELIELKTSRYDKHSCYAYKEGNVIKRLIFVGDGDGADDEATYTECQVNERLSDDGVMLLPKTEKGKAVKLSASTIERRTASGMVLSYCWGRVSLYNASNEQNYYQSVYEDIKIKSLNEFSSWVEEWCENTDESDIADIKAFASGKRRRIKYREGDYFRARIGRRAYVYGRILLNYDRFRKEKIPFWDIFFGKPLVVGVYHILTDRTDVSVEELRDLKMIPSQIIMDDAFYYGEFKIIGNEEVETENMDLPIHYGEGRSADGEDVLCFQQGSTFIQIEKEKALCSDFRYCAIGWNLRITIPTLRQCIEEGSNDAYWERHQEYNKDLRNPLFKKEKDRVMKQMSGYLPEKLRPDREAGRVTVFVKDVFEFFLKKDGH